MGGRDCKKEDGGGWGPEGRRMEQNQRNMATRSWGEGDKFRDA
jgi:hypothetical protein